MSFEHKLYRRLILCKINNKNINLFLKFLKDDGWTKDWFGKRGAKHSRIKQSSDQTRYHLRIYQLENIFFVLVHQEPTVLGDLVWHLKGLTDRIKTSFRTEKGYQSDDDKLELANYQKGNEYLKTIIENNSEIEKICSFMIEDNEYELFSTKFGMISLKLPFEILIEDLDEALYSNDTLEFYADLTKLLDMLEFRIIETENDDFLIFDSPMLKNFRGMIQKIDEVKIDKQGIENIQEEFEITSIILIAMDQEKFKSDEIESCKKNKIGIIFPMMFLKIFYNYRDTPISHEKFQLLFSKYGLIDANYIEEVFQPLEFSDLSKKTLEIFRFLKEQNDWVYIDLLASEFVKNRKYPRKQGKMILNFLTHPLVNLVITKKEKRRFRPDRTLYRAIKNFDEIQFRLKNIKSLLNNII